MHSSILNKIFKNIQKNRSEKLFYFPTKISIETGNICNLHCPLCPTNAIDMRSVEKGIMAFEDFKAIFDKIKYFVKTIDLFSWGEPFLNKDIAKMIKYIKEEKPKIRIFIDSNLNLITDEQIDSIVKYGLDVLNVSCDGASQEVYEKYRVGGNIDYVMENIKKIMRKEKELNSEKPRIIWKYLVFKHNQHEIKKARESARRMDIDFEVSGMRVDCGKEMFEKVEDSVKRDKDWIPDLPQYNNYKDLTCRKKFCGKPWKTVTIDWNGDVVPCGAIYDCSRYSFGNLLEQDFRKVWNNEKYILARRTILGKTVKKESEIICSICKENGYQFF